ncbi:MAG: phosphoribosylaminoimidazolesuccinocarboxamide synthase [Candidatus Altiarchaeota archaeon]|nr:phosphoribosylaminoimidazolesuccinocarboxamide synthase [Candidatus Altiarchaeota archaeon]
MDDIVLETNFANLKLASRGKVRDIYDLGDSLLVVATDRLSAFDSVLPTGIPHKGRVLNSLSAFWFKKLKGIIENHMISTDVNDYPEEALQYEETLEGRSMLVKKASVVPIECVARGYLAGSGWNEYKKEGTICKIRLPPNLRESDRLPETLFTPSTKAKTGHDVNISMEEAAGIAGKETADALEKNTKMLYEAACRHAEPRGIIIADTKFEFGIRDGKLLLIDEALTPDSSRFWPKGTYSPGGPQKSFDKQYVRDYLERVKWDKKPPAPPLPADIAAETSRKYLEAYERITGVNLL